ncbi:hypothetical protein X943_001633 [Babesia divergens]|uniref:Coiled-coil domain-containing protein n=1 Tax=Babesia divergens TaxID=32595 RepID=A0AAD9LK28_BABDI|nr:hypothetical protein X943_001633 [Babesia divergens]
MPRMTGINSKALEAKQRKREQREAQERKQQEELLDKYWEDNDKLVKAKQERKMEAQRKQQEKLQRKQEVRQLIQKEDSELISNKCCSKVGYGDGTQMQMDDQGGSTVPKVTRADILRMQLLQAEARAKESAAAEDNSYCDVTIANMNHENMRERALLEEQSIDLVKASGLDDVLDALSIVPKVEANSEKRLKAAYEAFESRMMPEMKANYPSLKYSQYKDMIFKAWKKSPENPMVMRNVQQRTIS